MNESNSTFCGGATAKTPKSKRLLASPGRLAGGLLGLGLLCMMVGCGADLGVLHPDTVLFNAKVVTVDEDFSIAEAVAIKDGKFLAVGSNSSVRGLAGDRTEVVDLEGATVLPGFNDPHVHFAHTVGFVVDELTQKYRASRSISEILAVVQEKIEQTPAGEIVWFFLGPGSPNSLEEGRYPNRRDLDLISPQHPVFLEYGWIRCQRLCQQPSPAKGGHYPPYATTLRSGPVGEIVKDASGEPTGVFLGRAAASIAHSVLVRHSVETLAKTIQHASELVVPYGITTIGDPNTNMSNVRENQNWMKAYQRLSSRGELMVRVNCIMRPAHCLQAD